MTKSTRRHFLQQLGAAAGVLLLSRNLPAFEAGRSTFEILVVGDSHISGQGLAPENKIYTLVGNWLQADVAGKSRKVNLKVKAHSGARIELHADELEAMQRLGDDPLKAHHPEANLSQPSIRAQIDSAGKEYADPAAVDLVMLSGGITNVLVANTVNPFIKESKLRALIHEYCNKAMFNLLETTTDTFPNAVVVVVGYFPVVSTDSNVNKISRYMFKAVKFPHPLHAIFTNGVSRQFMKVLRKKMALRSRLFVRESNREMGAAIEKVNAKLERGRVIFVESPITEENCFGTKNSLLWDTDRDNFPSDERYAERKKICPEVFAELKHHHYGKMSVRMCELAAIGHPNIKGAAAYAEAIKAKLAPVFDRSRLAKVS